MPRPEIIGDLVDVWTYSHGVNCNAGSHCRIGTSVTKPSGDMDSERSLHVSSWTSCFMSSLQLTAIMARRGRQPAHLFQKPPDRRHGNPG